MAVSRQHANIIFLIASIVLGMITSAKIRKILFAGKDLREIHDNLLRKTSILVTDVGIVMLALAICLNAILPISFTVKGIETNQPDRSLQHHQVHTKGLTLRVQLQNHLCV